MRCEPTPQFIPSWFLNEVVRNQKTNLEKNCLEAENVGAADMHQFGVDIIFVDCLVVIGNQLGCSSSSEGLEHSRGSLYPPFIPLYSASSDIRSPNPSQTVGLSFTNMIEP